MKVGIALKRHDYRPHKYSNITEGAIFTKMLVFLLPLIATNFLQVFYNMADMMIVGLSAEQDAMGAVGVSGTFNALTTNLIIGAAVGVNVIVAQRIGAKDDIGVSQAVHSSTLLMLILGFLVSGIGMLISRPLLSMMGAEGRLLDLSVLYSYICFAGAPFMSLSNCAISIFRAKGDSKTPLIVLSLCGLLNVFANLFFVLVLKMSIDGVALATVLSNVVSTVVLYAILIKEEDFCKFSFKKLKMYKQSVISILKIGIPAALQGMAYTLSHILNQSAIIQVNNLLVPNDSAYQPVVKANSVESNIELLLSSSVSAVYQTAVVFVGQNYGANNHERIKKSMWYSYLLGIIATVIFGGIVVIFKRPLASLYGITDGAIGSLENIAYNSLLTKISIIIYPYVFYAFVEVGSGVLRGTGRSTSSAIIGLLGSCIFRIVWVYTIFQANPTLETAYLTYPVSWVISAAVLLVFNLVVLKKEKIRMANLKGLFPTETQ